MDKVVSKNLNNSKVNDIFDNTLKFDPDSYIYNPTRDSQPVTIFNFKTEKNCDQNILLV